MSEDIKGIKVRTIEQQAIDNLKAIINSKNKIIEIEPPLEDTAQILLDYITNLQEKNERLQNIINELEKWLDDFYKSNRKWYNTELSNHDREYYKEYYINTEAMLVKFDKKLKELKEKENEER